MHFFSAQRWPWLPHFRFPFSPVAATEAAAAKPFRLAGEPTAGLPPAVRKYGQRNHRAAKAQTRIIQPSGRHCRQPAQRPPSGKRHSGDRNANGGPAAARKASLATGSRPRSAPTATRSPTSWALLTRRAGNIDQRRVHRAYRRVVRAVPAIYRQFDCNTLVVTERKPKGLEARPASNTTSRDLTNTAPTSYASKRAARIRVPSTRPGWYVSGAAAPR